MSTDYLIDTFVVFVWAFKAELLLLGIIVVAILIALQIIRSRNNPTYRVGKCVDSKRLNGYYSL